MTYLVFFQEAIRVLYTLLPLAVTDYLTQAKRNGNIKETSAIYFSALIGKQSYSLLFLQRAIILKCLEESEK